LAHFFKGQNIGGFFRVHTWIKYSTGANNRGGVKKRAEPRAVRWWLRREEERMCKARAERMVADG
jgi:hypothetical protein